MRIYITDNDLINNIKKSIPDNNIFDINVIRKIYSSEGIFHVIDNTLKRVIINDIPSDKLIINNYEFIVDRSTIEYDSEWYQLNPNHISEIVTSYAYAIDKNLQLVIENNSTVYFLTNNENNISTFLSELKLC